MSMAKQKKQTVCIEENGNNINFRGKDIKLGHFHLYNCNMIYQELLTVVKKMPKRPVSSFMLVNAEKD